MSTSSTSGVITSTAPTTSTASAAASAVSTNSIDVATVVSQLMTVENQPLNALKAKITASQTVISDLGVMKSKIATLQSALSTFEDPSTYNNPTASSSNSSVVTATASSAAVVGSSVNITVSQLAHASSIVLHAATDGTNYTDFSSATASTSVVSGATSSHPFTITDSSSGTTYTTASTSHPITGTGTVTGGVAAVTLVDLKNWVNGLGISASATVVQTTGSTNWVLQINGTSTGASNAISIGGAGIPSITTGGTTTSAAQVTTTAQDAVATIGGLTVNRATNAISDVITGMTFNLTGESSQAASVNVIAGADNSSAMLNTLMTAYNAVVTQYNTYTANAVTSSTPGDFANDPAMLSFVNNIKGMFAYGATQASVATITGAGSITLEADSNNAATGYMSVGGVHYALSSIGTVTPTSSQLITWINGLDAGVTAKMNTDNTSIIVTNSATSGNNVVDFSGLSNSISRTTTSLSGMGLDLQLDGTLQFNTASYQTAVTNGLFTKLSEGLKMGYASATSNLDTFLTSQISASSGVLAAEISTQQDSVNQMQAKQADLQDHLNTVQNNYITQYSALNALLFQLNSTSTSLASSLAAVTNINAGK